MEKDIAKRREEIEKQVPKTFMSPAYVEERDGVYAMYRDILVETNKPDGVGGFYREKLGKRIGPMFLFRPCRPGEEPDFITSKDGQPLLLFQIHPVKEVDKEARALSKGIGQP